MGSCGINTALPWLCHWGWALCGELWAQHGAPLALPLGLGCAGNCGFMLVPLAHPKIVSELWTGVGALRTWRRAVPVWGLEWCRASGDYGRAPLVVVPGAPLPLPRYCLAGARHSDGERKPLAND